MLEGKLSGGQLLVLSVLALKANVNGVVGAVTFSELQNLSGLTRLQFRRLSNDYDLRGHCVVLARWNRSAVFFTFEKREGIQVA